MTSSIDPTIPVTGNPETGSMRNNFAIIKSEIEALQDKDYFKGVYVSLSALQAAHPTGSAGDYAQVDSGAGGVLATYAYDLQDGWVLSNASGSGASNTDQLTEGTTNLYFTATRAINALLTGFTSGAGTLTAADSILAAIQKLAGNLALKLTANSAITADTKTKITYDTNGLVTAGADATKADIAEATKKRYITDAQQTAIGTIIPKTGTSTDNAIVRFNGTVGDAIQNSVVIVDDTGVTSGVLSMQFSDGASVTSADGKIHYDATKKTFHAGLGAVEHVIGETGFLYGKASAAISNTNVQIVYMSGTVGGSGTVTMAPTVSGITDSTKILGVAAEPIANNGFGHVQVAGYLTGLNTSGSAYSETWADGDVIWYNPTTGNPTKTKPVAPNVKIQVGIVIKASSGTSGVFFVEVFHGSTLGGTDDNVQLTSPVGGNLLTYDQTNTYWKNINLTAGNGVTINQTAGGAITVSVPNLSGSNTGDQDLSGKQDVSAKDASGGYAGLTLFKINFRNVANTFTSFFTNSNTAARTYTYQDKDYTVAGIDDINTTNFSGTLAKANGGTGVTTSTIVAQVVSTETGAVATGAGLIPADDTIPQNTNGDQYMSLAITPKNASSTLVIDVSIHLANSVANIITAALFQDSTANALAVGSVTQGSASGFARIDFKHIMTAGTTSATTFKIRVGGHAAGTTTFNGAVGIRYFGGAIASSIVITEYLP